MIALADLDRFPPPRVRVTAGAIGLTGVLLDVYSLGDACEARWRTIGRVSTVIDGKPFVFDECAVNLEIVE